MNSNTMTPADEAHYATIQHPDINRTSANQYDTKQVIYDRSLRKWVEVFPEDEGYERSITAYRTPQGWVTIPE